MLLTIFWPDWLRLLLTYNFWFAIRGAFDFLWLRSLTTETETQEASDWWEAIQQANAQQYKEMIDKRPLRPKKKMRRRKKPRRYNKKNSPPPIADNGASNDK